MVLYAADDLEHRSQAYNLLAIAAQEYWGLAPLPELVRSPTGKPAFPSAPGREFNLSHSGSFAFCALDHSPVGVDIQLVKSWRPTLPSRVCSPEELTWLDHQENLWQAFTTLWALKESRCKYSGEGLRGSIPAISVPLPQNGQALYFYQGLWFHLYFGTGWVGSLCALSPPPDQILWRSISHTALSSDEKDGIGHDL